MKMAKWIIAVSFLVLSGCGGDTEQQTTQTSDPRTTHIETMTNYGYGFHYDIMTPAGIRLRYAEKTERAFFTPEKIDADFRRAAACANYTASVMPLVIFVDEPIAGQYGGMAKFSTGTVLIYQYQSVYHEYMHFFLAVWGEGDHANAGHTSQLFSLCG